jgi:hypothetical protein
MFPPSEDNSTEVPQAVTEDKVAMTSTQRRFFASEQCNTARQALQDLVDSGRYNTDSNYFKTNDLEFVDRHLYYLSTHPGTNLTGYISNLKLMTGLKSRK